MNANGIVGNPFVEGALCVLLGIGCYAASTYMHVSHLSDVAEMLCTLGVGYMGHAAIAGSK